MVLAGEWPLIGRSAEFQRVYELVTTGGGAVLAGAAGVGKTRVSQACLERAARVGFASIRATGTHAASNLPFGALASLLPAVHLRDVQAVDYRSELLRRSIEALLDRAKGRRLVFLVDDAHLLDETSAILVHQLASARVARVLVVLRTGETAPDPIAALWKDGILERVELGGLTPDLMMKTLSVVLDGPVDGATADQLVARCRGNMLFMRELVQGALDSDILRFEDGLWRLVGPLTPSGRLIELVEDRLGRMTDDERRILEIVSFGEPLGPAELSSLADPALAEGLERRGLLSSQRDGLRLKIRLGHPVYGDVLRAHIPGLRARQIMRSLAEAVEATGARRREDTLRVATWRLEGGGARPELLLAGASIARWHYDFPLAERLARAAVAAGSGFEAALLTAQLAILQGRGAEAENELAALADETPDPHELAQLTITRMDNLAFYQGRIDAGIRIALDAQSVTDDAQLRDAIAARRIAVLLATEGPLVAVTAAEALLDRIKTGRSLAWAVLAAARGLVRLGRFEEAMDFASRGYSELMGAAGPSDWYPWLHLNCRCNALIHAGRIDEAKMLADEHYRKGVAAHSIEAQAHWAWELCKTFLMQGQATTAARYGWEAARLFHQLGQPQLEYFCLPYLAYALALGGSAVEAQQVWDKWDGLGLPSTLYIGADPAEARAWTAVAHGDLAQARQLLSAAADQGEAIGDLVGATNALHSLARLGEARSVVKRMADIAAPIEGCFAPTRVAHVKALCSADAPELLTVSTAFEALGATLLAAEAAADAAVIYRQREQLRDAAVAEQRAASLADACEGAETPALRDPGSRAKLIPSELETALLAASGSTNKEIAAKLHLSVRTVETYLQRAYVKLGISGRTELSQVLAPHLKRNSSKTREYR